MAEEGKIYFSSELDEKGFTNGANNIKKQIRDVTSQVEKSGEQMDSVFKNLGKTITAAFAVKQLWDFEKKIIEVRGEMEKLQISFETLAGTRAGKQLYEDIKQFTLTTPMMMSDLAKGAQTLLGFNIEAKKVMPILKQIGDISMGDAQKFNSLTLAFAQMSSTGKLMGQDLLQMINAGFNPLVLIADKTGKKIAELKDEMSQGKITVEMVEEAFADATSEGGKFYGMLDKQSKGMAGAISNLKGAYDNMLNDIGEKQQGILVDGINLATNLLNHYEEFAKVLLTVIAAYGSYKAVLMLTAIAHKAVALYDNIRLVMMYRKELGLATAAQQAFNKTLKANPIGLLVGAVTAIVAATSLFSSKTEEATEALEKLREAALGDTQKMATYRAVLDTVDKSSKQYKNTLHDLNEMAEEYHTTLFTENDTVDELTAKYNSLTEAIRANAAQRLLAEASSKAAKDSMDAEKEAMDELMSDAESATYQGYREVERYTDAGWTTTKEKAKINSENIRNITSATWNAISTLMTENARSIADAFEQSEGEGEKRVEGLVGQIEDMLRALGVTDKEIEGFHSSLYDYVRDSAKGFQTAYNELSRSEAQLKGIANAAQETKDVTNEAIEEMNYEQLQDELKKVQKEINNINNSDLEVNVKDEQLRSLNALLEKIQGYLNTQITVGSDSDLEKRLKAAKEERDKHVVGTADWEKWNKEVGTLNSTLKAHRKQYAENEEKTSKAGETAAQRAAKLRKQKEEYLAEQESQAREFARQEYDLWSETERAAISAMKDGSEKSIRQINLDFDNRKEELRRRYEDLRKEKWEADKRLWEANPENKNTPFAGKITDAKYNATAKEERAYAQQREYAQREYEKQLAEQAKAERQALYDYIKEYGSIQQQKEAITKEYDEKIADATDAIQRESLEQQKKRLIEELNMKELQGSLNWEVIFNDMDRVSTKALEKLRDDMRKALNSGDLDPKNAQVLSEKILEAENEISKRTNVFASMIPALQDRLRITNQVKEAEKEIARLQGVRNESRGGVVSALSAASGVSAEFISQMFDSIGADAQGWINILGLDPLSEEAERVTLCLTNLGKATDDLTASEKSLEALREIYKGDLNFKEGIKEIFSNATNNGDFMGIVSLANTNIQSMTELVDAVGLSNTSFGEAVGQFSEGTNAFVGAIQSFASGDIIGGVTGIIKGFQSYGRLLGIGGGNAAETNAALDRLNDRNAILTDSIDRLNDTMSKQGGANAIKTYEEMVKLQKELERNLQEQVRLQMDYHEAHHSFNHYWNGVGDRELSSFNQLHNTNWNGDLGNLDPETAAAIMADVNMREKIKSTGKGGYGERVLEWIEQLAEQAGKAQEATDALYESLTAGSTRDSVFSDFLNDLYDLANGVDDVTENIEERWQQMVNKMVINNVIGSKMQSKVEQWYEELAKLNEEYSKEGSQMTDAMYQAALDEYKRKYDSLIDEGRNEIELLKRSGIINPNGAGADEQSATVQAMERITVDQADELIGRMNAGQMIWEQHKGISEQIRQSLEAVQQVMGGTFGRDISDLVSLAQTRNIQLSSILEACEGIRQDMTLQAEDLQRIINTKL